MNRRDILCAFGTLSLSTALGGNTLAGIHRNNWNAVVKPPTVEPLPMTVAGIHLVDSEIARLATALVAVHILLIYLTTRSGRFYLLHWSAGPSDKSLTRRSCT